MAVPITLFIVIGVVLCAYYYFRYRARQDVQHTVRLAVERGAELTPEVLEAFSAELTPSALGDLRKGVLWLALAAALGLMSWAIDERDLLGIGGFPLMLGIAYLALWLFLPRKGP